MSLATELSSDITLFPDQLGRDHEQQFCRKCFQASSLVFGDEFLCRSQEIPVQGLPLILQFPKILRRVEVRDLLCILPVSHPDSSQHSTGLYPSHRYPGHIGTLIKLYRSLFATSRVDRPDTLRHSPEICRA